MGREDDRLYYLLNVRANVASLRLGPLAQVLDPRSVQFLSRVLRELRESLTRKGAPAVLTTYFQVPRRRARCVSTLFAEAGLAWQEYPPAASARHHSRVARLLALDEVGFEAPLRDERQTTTILQQVWAETRVFFRLCTSDQEEIGPAIGTWMEAYHDRSPSPRLLDNSLVVAASFYHGGWLDIISRVIADTELLSASLSAAAGRFSLARVDDESEVF